MVVGSTGPCARSDERPPVSDAHVQTTEYQLLAYSRWQKGRALAGAHGSAEQQGAIDCQTSSHAIPRHEQSMPRDVRW